MVFMVFWWSPLISQKLQLVHPALQGSRRVKSHCWNAFVSQIKPVQAKAAWSRAAGIVSSPWQGRQARRKEGEKLPCLLHWKHLDSWVWTIFGVLSLLFLFLFPFLPTVPQPPRGRALSNTHVHFQWQTSHKLPGRNSIKQARFSLRFLLCLWASLFSFRASKADFYPVIP